MVASKKLDGCIQQKLFRKWIYYLRIPFIVKSLQKYEKLTRLGVAVYLFRNGKVRAASNDKVRAASNDTTYAVRNNTTHAVRND